jgi:succinyl-diaminopimelate desuccinylase
MSELSVEAATLLVSELVKIPSVNPPGDEKACAGFIEEYLRGAGVVSRLVDRPFPHRPQVLGTLGRGSGPVLALNGHMDVVPEGNLDEWSHAPYGGEIVDGRVYGRGATDMKGGLASMMLAAKALARESTKWRGTLLLQFVIGEETGDPGTIEILKEQPRPDWGIVLEATELMVGVAARGLTWWELTTYGKAAHAGYAAGGLNAIDMMTGMMGNIAAYREELAQRPAHPLVGPPSCTVTMISGGTKENVVPAECRMLIDRRMVPGETLVQVEAEIRRLWPEVLVERSSTRCLQFYEPAEISADDSIVQELRASMKRVLGRDPDIYGESASTDARSFINDVGVPAVIWGPGDLDGSHIADESIAAAQVLIAAEVLVDLCRTLLT